MKSLFFISIILLNLYVGNVDAQTLEPYTVIRIRIVYSIRL